MWRLSNDVRYIGSFKYVLVSTKQKRQRITLYVIWGHGREQQQFDRAQAYAIEKGTRPVARFVFRFRVSA